jgi:HEAT repeat protein
MAAQKDLLTIFEADQAAREAEARLFEGTSPEALADLFASAVDEAIADADRPSAIVRLERLADLCAQVPGPKMADALVKILGDEEPAVRVAAGEAILDVAYERYAEVARAIERALDAGREGPAMRELPYVLAEVGEPSALKLIRRFLSHPDAHTVAAGIEALASLGDPAAVPALEALADDARTASIEELDEDVPVTISELAREAIEELRAART